MSKNYKNLIPEITSIFDGNAPRNQKLQALCNLLQTEISTYDWVGFYFKNGDKQELILGPYAGLATDHTVIPFGKGICGQVALSHQNLVVDDVSLEDNYISCNINVKSEIVVPLIINQDNIGQIDIDSNTLKAFDEYDEAFLEEVLKIVAKEFN